MTSAFTSLQLGALTLAIATLGGCGGGSDTPVAENECTIAPAAAAPLTGDPAAPVTTSTRTDDDDHDDDHDSEHDKVARTKSASTCPAPAGGTTTAAAPADSGAPTAPAPATAAAPAPAASASALNGKSLYAGNCASCHGGDPTQNISKILRGTSASNTLGAIASNKGGMGFLSGSIGAAQANDIAAYLANPGI